MIPKLNNLISENNLLKAAINLIISAGVSALFGFIFWTVVARSFHSETIGLATTILSMSMLISLLGLAGFDTLFVKFLPKSKHRNAEINNGLLIAGGVTAILAVVFCFVVPVLSPKISFIDDNIWNILAFIVVSVLTTWNTLTNAVLVAYRKTSYVVFINISFSAVKMVLPFLFSKGGPMTLFIFTGVAQLVNVILSIAALINYCDYKPSRKLHFDKLKDFRRYGSAAYASSIINLLPDSALPLIVINVLGATSAAYFYIAFTVANLLYTIVFSTNQALLAEASHHEDALIKHVKRGLLIGGGILIPVSAVIIIFSPFILSLFGKGYQDGAVGILRILCASGVAVMLYSVLSFIFKHTKNLKGMLFMTATNGIAIIGLAIPFAKWYGLTGIGWAWLIGTCLAVVVGICSVMSTRDKHEDITY
jgi:O-antigen/teichoic acid export membrane protein